VSFHDDLVTRLEYFDGHSDTLGFFADGNFLRSAAGWRGLETILRRHVISSGERVLIVDDWAETGSKALTVRRLIESCGGVYASCSLLVDQLPDAVREELGPVVSVAFADELRG
jgi:adenine phosphoribosyltransferase